MEPFMRKRQLLPLVEACGGRFQGVVEIKRFARVGRRQHQADIIGGHDHSHPAAHAISRAGSCGDDSDTCDVKAVHFAEIKNDAGCGASERMQAFAQLRRGVRCDRSGNRYERPCAGRRCRNVDVEVHHCAPSPTRCPRLCAPHVSSIVGFTNHSCVWSGSPHSRTNDAEFECRLRSTSWRLQMSAIATRGWRAPLLAPGSGKGPSCAAELTSGAHPVADVAAALDLETVGADAPIIVVGVDGSDSGRAALRAGAARSALEHGHLLAVHVTPAMPFWLSYSPFCHVEWNECTTLLAADALNHTEQAATAVNVSWSFHHVGGGIVSGLTAAALASHASLVVVAEGVRHQRPHLCPAHRLARHGLLPVQVVYANGSAK